MDIQNDLLACIERADRMEAMRLLDAWCAEHGRQRVVDAVLEPVLRTLGDSWQQKGGMNLAHGYMAAKITEAVLVQVAASTTHPGVVRGPVVLGNAEDDCHALGRRMVGTFLRAAGWQVEDLGNDVPAVTFVDAAVATGARVIGVSAMMYTTAVNIRQVRDELDRRGLAGRIRLAVGGAVFGIRPGLMAEVGGDGTCVNAIESPDLMARLWAAAEGGHAAP